MAKLFTGSQLQALAKALGHTDEGLTGTEIKHLFRECKLIDPGPITKWKRIHDAFVLTQNKKKNRTNIIQFIRQSLRPEKYIGNPGRFETLRSNTNTALLFCGLNVKEDGSIVSTTSVKTLTEAENRAGKLSAKLKSRKVHKDVLKFCKAELLADNYFHAVQEAVKSVFDKIRSRTGLTDDGGTLVDRAFSGQSPMLVINSFKTDSEKSEQKGFANIIKGTFGMFRNPTAHEARIKWNMEEEDAVDLLSLVSLIHRKLDRAKMPPRT